MNSISGILVDHSATAKWHSGFKREDAGITEVVIHHTAGDGNVRTLREWMLGGELSANYKKGIGLFHYAVDREGAVWESGDPAMWWYHSCSGRHDAHTIGIELVHRQGEFSNAQYASLAGLVFDQLLVRYNTISRIVSHDYNYKRYSGRVKGCPGKDFKWSRLEQAMQARGLQYVKDTDECYVLLW